MEWEEWGVGRVGSGEWGVECGERGVECGERGVGSGEWGVESGKWGERRDKACLVRQRPRTLIYTTWGQPPAEWIGIDATTPQCRLLCSLSLAPQPVLGVTHGVSLRQNFSSQ